MAEKQAVDTVNFQASLGMFYYSWTYVEALIDFGLCRFLRLTFAEAHILTAGMEWGRKAALLDSLIAKSDHKNKEKLLVSLRVLRNESLRNAFAHSYIASDETNIWFVERQRGQPYKAREHQFTLATFGDHVEKLVYAMRDFGDALELGPNEFRRFMAAALSASNKA